MDMKENEKQEVVECTCAVYEINQNLQNGIISIDEARNMGLCVLCAAYLMAHPGEKDIASDSLFDFIEAGFAKTDCAEAVAV